MFRCGRPIPLGTRYSMEQAFSVVVGVEVGSKCSYKKTVTLMCRQHFDPTSEQIGKDKNRKLSRVCHNILRNPNFKALPSLPACQAMPPPSLPFSALARPAPSTNPHPSVSIPRETQEGRKKQTEQGSREEKGEKEGENPAGIRAQRQGQRREEGGQGFYA